MVIIIKTLLVGINAKYIHPNLAIRLLKKNTRYPVDIIEYTTKDDSSDILDDLKNTDYEVIGFSCYIWNITIIKEISYKLKEIGKIVILGGPEVSYNGDVYIENKFCDYVIKNEGEEAFDLLLGYLHNDNLLAEVPNLYHNSGYTFDKVCMIDKIKPAYDLYTDLKNRIMYIESSRGCPYRCSYCMASLDNKLRHFEIEMVKFEVKQLIEYGAMTFKFLDRTMNADKKIFFEIIEFIIKNHKKGNSFQFEIAGDIISSEVIDYINKNAPKGLFRFEIGIQSTNDMANKAVNRFQNSERLINTIKKIKDADIIEMHLDLIAGLPYEDLESFIKTTNDVISLRPKELQIGFLKFLEGTELKTNASKYGYIYDTEPPYEIIKNDFMSFDDLKMIHTMEDSFDFYYNKGFFKRTMEIILDNEKNYFMFFFDLGRNDIKYLSFAARYEYLDLYIRKKEYYPLAHEALICDYLNHFAIKPEIWWNEKLDKKEKNLFIERLIEDGIVSYNKNTMIKYSLIINLEDSIIVAIYLPDEREIIIIDKNAF